MESPLETCNCKRITLAQKSIIVSFMEKNPQFHMGKFGPFFTLQDRNRMWEELAKELNSNGGAVKDVNKWKKSWVDYKSEVRKKISDLQKKHNEAGNKESDATDKTFNNYHEIVY
ncbi:hypothetical protein JTE90_021895 [Oedothorax gibbosus]|uniref:Regulatory protein zeste n=1 Tax=Oedothorax gibbosus TaxID=931172 RepID=A0AAV6V0L9_9ARAC|nr:hypothetical protein JTE90_021895 [Oedothorax gibbosus]